MAVVDQTTTTWLTLDLWHPNCWAIQATGQTEGGVLAHSIYNSPQTDGSHQGKVKGLFTAFADDEASVDALLDAIRDSEHAGELSELQERRTHHVVGVVFEEELTDDVPGGVPFAAEPLPELGEFPGVFGASNLV